MIVFFFPFLTIELTLLDQNIDIHITMSMAVANCSMDTEDQNSSNTKATHHWRESISIMQKIEWLFLFLIYPFIFFIEIWIFMSIFFNVYTVIVFQIK